MQLQTLSEGESKALAEAEAVIERHREAYIQAGLALLAIRDGRLYRGQYKTFEDYCRERWGFGRGRGYQLAKGAEIAQLLSTTVDSLPLPQSEAVARELSSLKPDEIRLVWTIVHDTAPGGEVTAAHVRSITDVFREMVTTQAIDAGEGEQIHISEALQARITEETYERMKRQEEHIRGKNDGATKYKITAEFETEGEWTRWLSMMQTNGVKAYGSKPKGQAFLKTC